MVMVKRLLPRGLFYSLLFLWRKGAALQLWWTGFSLEWLLILLRVGGLQQLQLPGSRAQAQQLWLTGLIAPWPVGSSQTRNQTHVSWQVDSVPLCHQGIPKADFLVTSIFCIVSQLPVLVPPVNLYILSSVKSLLRVILKCFMFLQRRTLALFTFGFLALNRVCCTWWQVLSQYSLHKTMETYVTAFTWVANKSYSLPLASLALLTFLQATEKLVNKLPLIEHCSRARLCAGHFTGIDVH